MIKLINTASLYGSLYEAVEFCKQNSGKELQIIIPDKLALFMEKFLLEHLNISASFNIKITTLNRFAKRKCMVNKDSLIDDVGAILLIHRILNENINVLSTLKSKAYSFSYAENILRTVNQFKASKITWQEMEKFSSNNLQLQTKILDLAFVYKEYEDAKAGLLDSADLFLMSTMFVSEGLRNADILFVGFDDFTAIEYSILERLAIENNVNVIVNYNSSKNKHIFNNEIYSQLKAIAYANGLDIKVEDSKIKFSNLKNFLHKNLFAATNENFVLDDEIIKVVSSNNIKEELNFVARDIRARILQGAKYSNFGVAVFDLNTKVNDIKEIFSKYEINYYLDSENYLNKSVFYKFICSLIKYNLESYNLSHLIDIISSPFFALEHFTKQQIIDKLITIGFKGKLKESISLLNEMETEINKLVEFLYLFKIDSNAKVEEIINKFKAGFERIDVDNILTELSLNVDLQDKMLLRKSKELVYNLFDEILKYNANISSAQFLDVFLNVASVVKVNNLPLTLDAVKIVDANNTMEIFDNLYLVNCTTDTAPSLKYDCGVILDAEIAELNFKQKLTPTIAHINNLSKLRLFNSSLLFEKSLTVTYSQKPSDLIIELLNKIQIQTRQGVMNIVPLIDFSYGKYLAMSESDYVEFLCKNDKNSVKIGEKIVKNKNFNKISNNNLNIFESLKEISASYLENYFNCPLLCFLQNGIKVKPRECSDILPLDIGNILHEIMFKYYHLKKDVGDIYTFCRDEVFAFACKNDRLKLNINSPILTALIDEAVRVINAVDYIDKNSSFIPFAFEYEFKGRNALKLKNINIRGKVDRADISNDLIRIIDYKSGKADANLKELYYGNKLQLFLYASAMERIFKKNLAGSFYLPLRNAYSTEKENTYAFKGFFLNEDFVLKAMDTRFDIGVKGDILDVTINKDFKAGRTKGVSKLESNEMATLKNYAKKVSEQAVEEIKCGYIAPSPSGNKNPCNYCPYAHICLRKSANRKVRETSSVDIDSFKEVEDV